MCKTKIIIQIAILMVTIYQDLQMTGQQWLIAVGYCKDIQKDFHLILTIKMLFLDSNL